MRILVIEPDPEFGGGSEGFALNMRRELAKRDHEIILSPIRSAVRCLADMSGSSPRPCSSTCAVFPRQPVRMMKQLTRLARLIRWQEIDRIFSSHLGFPRVATALCVLTGAMEWPHPGPPAMDCSISTRISQKLLGGGISPAPDTKETWADARWPARRLDEVRSFVDRQTFRPASDKIGPRKRLGLPPNRALLERFAG
jgi:hypothetical protein